MGFYKVMMKSSFLCLGIISTALLSGCERVEFKNSDAPGKSSKASKAKASKTVHAKPKIGTNSLITDYAVATPKEIITRAHKAAGGLSWARPTSLAMGGYAVFYKNGQSHRHESHKMWRVYTAGKTNAHQVDGKVRIHSVKDGEPVINISYDGTTTYTDKGPQPKTAADKGWSSNFGFGVIRHALDVGYRLERLPDDLIDGRAAYMIKVFDPAGGETQFGISQKDYKILKVGFETARGWHERIYSDFYSNPDEDWVQPGRVRLYYNGEKSNEVIWERYAVNQDLPDCLFVLPQAEDCAG